MTTESRSDEAREESVLVQETQQYLKVQLMNIKQEAFSGPPSSKLFLVLGDNSIVLVLNNYYCDYLSRAPEKQANYNL